MRYLAAMLTLALLTSTASAALFFKGGIVPPTGSFHCLQTSPGDCLQTSPGNVLQASP